MVNYFSSNIKYLRKLNNMTQDEIVRAIFNNDQRVKISKLENDKVKQCDISDIQAYADYFGLTIDDLINKDLQLESPTNKEKMKLNNEFPIYTEKNFKKIGELNKLSLILYGLVIVFIFFIKVFNIFGDRLQNFVLSISIVFIMGYSLYLLISKIINSKKNTEKYFITNDKNMYYFNDEKFKTNKYKFINILIFLFLFLTMSMTFVSAKKTDILVLLIFWIIYSGFTISCTILSFKKIYKKSNDINYLLYYNEKMRYIATMICYVYMLMMFSFYEYELIYIILGFIFMAASYIYNIISLLLVHEFYKGYSFKIM